MDIRNSSGGVFKAQPGRLFDAFIDQILIVTFQAAQCAAEAIRQAMARERINVSVSDGSGTLVSFQHRGLTAVVRASLHYFNTEEEIDIFVRVLEGVLRRPV